MTGTVIFLGPSLKLAEAKVELDADYRPPARRGDVIRAVEDGADVIGLVDGFTHLVPAVTHKEFLFALSRGVRAYGAASLGALRAAELVDFGMIGVGRTFEAYRAGEMTSDEVAVCHGPMELGYCVVTEAMVNVRATVAAAVAVGLLRQSAAALLDIARNIHFAARTWKQLMSSAHQHGLPADELQAFEAWLPAGHVDQKRLDAIALLKVIASHARDTLKDARRPPCFRPTQSFASLYESVTVDSSHQHHRESI